MSIGHSRQGHLLGNSFLRHPEGFTVFGPCTTHRRKAHSHTLTVVFKFSCAALSLHSAAISPTLPHNPLQHFQKWPCFPASSAALTSLAVGPIFTAVERRANVARHSHCRSPPPGCGGGVSRVRTPTAEMHWLTAQ